jgi:15-cis-phytoene synthase
MTPNEYCQQKTQQSSSSFYYSFLFLNETQQQAMMALYAYCREVDDIVDQCSDESIAASKLHWWRQETHSIFHGTPNHPVSIALKIARQNYPLEENYFQELISGMEMDLHTKQYSSFEDLSHYCYRAASVVGLLTIEILGYSGANTVKYAHDLGIALQLINILRDVKEDAKRGRIYLPQDELKQFNVTQAMLLSKTANNNTLALFKFQADRAREYYNKAFSNLAQADRPQQRTSIIMAEIYLALLNKIESSHYPVLEKRVCIPKLKKLWIAWTVARRER